MKMYFGYNTRLCQENAAILYTSLVHHTIGDRYESRDNSSMDQCPANKRRRQPIELNDI